jgi:hypothetical protein
MCDILPSLRSLVRSSFSSSFLTTSFSSSLFYPSLFCRTLPVKIDPDLFLSRCVKCNHFVLEEKDWNLESQLHFKSVREGSDLKDVKEIPAEIPLYMCSNQICRQIYWFSARENSSSVRSKEQAEHLYRQIVQPCTPSPSLSTSDFGCSELAVASMYARHKYMSISMNSSSGVSNNQITDKYQLFQSAYPEQMEEEEVGTNQRVVSTVRNGFDGLIDHILFSEEFRCVRLAYAI